MSPDDFHFGPASAVSLAAVANLYTRTFADYFYDAQITPALMQMFVRVEQIDLSRSPILYAGAEPVGLATVGLRGTRAYCKGFGIVVPYRGRGLAALLCGEVIRQARDAHAQTLQLGVLQQNERAVRTYLGAGFSVHRELHSFEWDARSDAAARPANAAVQTVQPQLVLQYYAALHPAEPVWGRDLPSLQAMAGLSGLALAGNEGYEAYLLYDPGDDRGLSIKHLAAAGVEQAVALLAHLQQQTPYIACNNEPDGSPMLDAFTAAGFRNHANRFDLRLELQ